MDKAHFKYVSRQKVSYWLCVSQVVKTGELPSICNHILKVRTVTLYNLP